MFFELMKKFSPNFYFIPSTAIIAYLDKRNLVPANPKQYYQDSSKSRRYNEKKIPNYVQRIFIPLYQNNHFTLIVKNGTSLYHFDSINNNIGMEDIFRAARVFLKCSPGTEIIQVPSPMQVENECLYRACIHALLIDQCNNPLNLNFECLCKKGSIPNRNDAYALRLFIASCLYGQQIPRQVMIH